MTAVLHPCIKAVKYYYLTIDNHQKTNSHNSNNPVYEITIIFIKKMRTPYSYMFLVIMSITFSSQVAYGQALTVQWQQLYGGNDHDNGTAGIIATGGGYLFGAWSFSSGGDHLTATYGNSDFWVIRTDDYGNMLWEQSYGGEGVDILTDMVTSSNGYILAGYSNSSSMQVNDHHGAPYPNSADDFWVVGIDTGGNLLWSKS